ncbi:fibrocystin-L-like [Argopecten irradians]|uniref:fibrocystin-L-like n=1 Tax=Argopecten irradians TaxID=31199 RepID=UPI0037246411
MSRVACAVLLLAIAVGSGAAKQVTSISNCRFGTNGGQRITIYGSGFAARQFTLDDPNLGNQVTFYSNRNYPCDVLKEDSTINQITCYTAPMPEGVYNLEVTVDSVPISASAITISCSLEVWSWRTPSITSVFQRTMEPGGIVEIEGKFFSDKFGANIAQSSNGRSAQIRRLRVGGDSCLLKDGDTFYGLELFPSTDGRITDYGRIRCKMDGSTVGNLNISLLITEFGRTATDLDTRHISAGNVIYMIQTYAVIESITAPTGSINGGANITIKGRNFDQTKSPVSIEVGETSCLSPIYHNSTHITCVTPPKPSAPKAKYQGGRGVTTEKWTQTTKSDLGEVHSLDSSASDYERATQEYMIYKGNTATTNEHVVKLSTFYHVQQDGAHRFAITVAGAAEVYIDQSGTEIDPTTSVVKCYGTCNRYQRQSDPYNFVRGQIIYVVMVCNVYNGSNCGLMIKRSTANLRGDSTGDVDQETQAVIITSNETANIQKLKLSGFGQTSSTATEVSLSIQNAASGDRFRLRIFGYYSQWISAAGVASDVEVILNKMPMFEGTISVSNAASHTETSPVFDISFNNDIGNIPVEDIVPDTGNSQMSVTVRSVSTGQAGGNVLTLQLKDDYLVPPITLPLTAAKLESALSTAIGAICPKDINNQDAAETQDDFEDAKLRSCGDSIDATVKAFCGRRSLKNPDCIVTQTAGYGHDRKLCFAYKGNMSSNYEILYKRSDGSNGTVRPVTNLETTESWGYTCVLLSTLVPEDATRVMSVKFDGDSGDTWIDAVMVTQETGFYDNGPDDVMSQIRSQPKLGAGNAQLIGSVTVRQESDTDGSEAFLITIWPQECGFNIPQIQPYDSAKIQGTSDVFQVGTNANRQVQCSTTLSANPPVTGSVTLTFMGKTFSVKANATAEQIQQSFQDVGEYVSVVHTGNCSQVRWDITFTERLGNLPEMSATSNLQGQGVTMSVQTVVNGSTNQEVGGDLTSTVNSITQVTAKINNIPTACASDCSYTFSDAVTPVVTGIQPLTGPPGTTLTVVGSGFTSTPIVQTGEVLCTVISFTATQILCTVGTGPSEPSVVTVNVDGVGFATKQSSDMFTSTASITSISPVEGSLGGGTDLTIAGFGFSTSMAVTVGNNPCTLVGSVQPGQIACITPAASTAQSVDVVVTRNSGANIISGQQFTYQQSLTAQLDSFSPSSSSVSGGGRFTLTGANFGSSPPTVLVGEMSATIISSTSTSIVAEFPSQGVGNYKVNVKVGHNGYAAVGPNVPTASYTLNVNAISQDKGSVYGGTNITVVGQGFGTEESALAVDFGSTSCEVMEVTDSRFICRMQQRFQTFNLDNTGESSIYGQGFAWNDPDLTVEVGDKIAFSWTGNTRDTLIKVVEIDGPQGNIKNSGWDSGSPVNTGSYRVRVPAVGVYFYRGIATSSTSDSQIVYEGRITASLKPQTTEAMTVLVNNFEATYNPQSGVAIQDDAQGCGKMMSSRSGCNMDPIPTGSSDRFSFTFTDCYSGEVTEMTLERDILTLQGSGWSSELCQNYIFVGEHRCNVETYSTNEIRCQIETSSPTEMQVSMWHDLSVIVAGRGESILNLRESRCVPQPFVDTIGPSTVSSEGGATMRLSGVGLSNTYVTVDGYRQSLTHQSYTDIQFTAQSGSSGTTKTVEVYTNAGTSVDCTNCQFLYNQNVQALTIQPTSVDGSQSTTFTIIGQGFNSLDSVGIAVKFGSTLCGNVQVESDTEIQCEIANLPIGQHALEIKSPNYGILKSNGNAVDGVDKLTTLNPAQGSLKGNTSVTITGNGFIDGQSSVTIGGNPCDVSMTDLTTITCWTRAVTASGTQQLAVTVGDVTYRDSLNFEFATSATPVITAVSPSSGPFGTDITITGTGFSTENLENSVFISNTPCAVKSYSATSIVCTTGQRSTGQFPVAVYRNGQGKADGDFSFTYAFTASSISPNSGSSAGGQTVTINGDGFDDSVTVQFGDVQATIAESTEQSIILQTPPQPDTATANYDVVVASGSQSVTLTYTYDSSKTPTVTSVSPKYGGTSGGTLITIAGSGFGTVQTDIDVSIGGVQCLVQSATDTEVTCMTGQRERSISTNLELRRFTWGSAVSTNAQWKYYDMWSADHSWSNGDGTGGKPVASDFVVIPEGKTLLLDEDTPVLKMLLIDGGQLIFDERDVTLNAEYILITNNGSLIVGTEDEPFQHKATIILHGHTLSTKLPIYGSKALITRNGTLEIHGKPIPRTWTRLGSTANIGDTQVILQESIYAKVGDQIVIATTGDRHSQKETEVRVVTAVSADGRTLTFSQPLEYKHLGISIPVGSKQLEARAEVGLLTRNVVIRGNEDVTWEEEIEECPDGFDTGEFTTQTCFQGRFGAETGSSQHGGHVIGHTSDASMRLENVELDFMGQAFQLGRYPIHFHLMGDKKGCYVRGASIHNTFNRAINIHGTHNLLIENNVAYNIMGGAFFLEDGVETGNVYRYNLLLFVKASSSLLNDDVTPAAFWATNPNNTYEHNAVAGGTHFGWWYRLLEHPEGPSASANINPRKIQYGTHYNNTAHSLGWFGIWIFEVSDPRNGTGDPQPAQFNSFNVFNAEKGIEFVNTGAFDVNDLLSVGNELAGWEAKLLLDDTNDVKYLQRVRNSVIAANVPEIPRQIPGKGIVSGVVLPFKGNTVIENVEFHNFDEEQEAAISFTSVQGTCIDKCGGFNYNFSGIGKHNSNRMVSFRWIHEGAIRDLDGSLSGTAGNVITTTNGILPDSCTVAPAEFNAGLVESRICPQSVEFGHMSFNHLQPDILFATNAVFNIRNEPTRSEIAPYAFKRVISPEGIVGMLKLHEEYSLSFEGAAHLTNISYDASFFSITNNAWVIICHRLTTKPDMFYYYDGMGMDDAWNMSTGELNPNVNVDGDWHFDESSNEFCYLVSGKKNYSRPVTTKGNTVKTKINAFKCELVGCKPTDPNTTPRKCSSENAILYSNIDWGSIDKENCLTWDSDTSTCKQPGPDDSWIIPEDKWIVLNESPPPLDQVIIYGTLEVQENAENIRLAANYIYNFMGQLIVGCGEDSRFTGTFTLTLRGNHSTPEFQNPAGQRTPNIGAKALAGIGGVMMHGIEIPKPWTTLAATAEPGATSLTLSEHVSWGVGGEIVITPTGYDPAKYEYGVIQSINRYTDTSGNERTELTLEQPLQYRHIYYHEDLPNGKGYTLAADVGYLTRNIKVEGEAYAGQESEEFGGRVLIGGGQTANGDLYNGFGMFSFVQFTRMGQFGYTSPYDPRDAIAFKDTGDANIEGRYSYVRGCSFRNSYSSTISVRGADNLHLQWNVITESVGPGIFSDATHTVVRNNLVNGFKFPGSYNGRYEAANTLVPAAVTLFGSSAELNDNAIAGSERACWTGLPEMQEKDGPNWTNNKVYSSLFGVVLFPNSISSWPSQPVQISNFAVYRIAIYAVYMNIPMSLKYSNLILVDNKLSLSTFLFGPDPLMHEYDYDKYVTTDNCIFVGQSPIFDSANDIPNANAPSYRISTGGTVRFIPSSPVGYHFAACTSGHNNAPLKPIINTMSYNTISLQQNMENCLFAHWNDESFAITSPPNADDYLPPLITKNIHLEDVGANNVFWRRPSSLGKINPSDCVDMECDAHKNSLIIDKDGTLTRRNQPSEIFPIDTHWNGDRRYGKGDYRIPNTLLSYPNGSKIQPDTIYNHPGIARTGSCVANNELRYWNCTTNDHEVVMLESMDSDTETRRLSPVALLACPDNTCFINLLNGPQDHGWCSGYTCKLRLSLFPLIVPKVTKSLIYFTGVSPQAVRFHLPMAAPEVKVLVSLYCSSTNKLEVLLNDKLVHPKNSKLEDGNVVILPPTQNENMDFTPSLADPCGTNFLNGQNMEIVLCGKQIVDLVTKPSIMVGLTVMSIDDFFGKNVQANLAAFLGISQSQIRIVDIESDTSSRKKRSTGTTTYYLEISDTSCSNANCEGGTSTGMTYADLEVLTSAILNGFQTGALSSSLNISINGMTITEALPPVEDPHWQAFVESPVTNRAVQVIDAFTFHSTIVTGTEGNVFTQQPKVHFNDINGAHVANLGVAAIPWQVQAVLRAGSGSNILATLAGNTTVNFVNGWANFTDLSLSHSGTGFIIDFNIIFPESNYTLESEPLAVALRSFKVDLAYSAGNVYTSRAHELRFKIVDTITNSKVDNLVWNGAVWSAVLSASSTSGYGGSFTGTTSASFNLGTSEVTFNDLVFDSPGTQVLIITVTSTTGYSLTMQKEVVIMASEMQSMVPVVSQSLSVKYDVDFNTYGNLDFAAGVFLNPMMTRYPHIQFSGLTVTQGSVIISVTVAGNTSTVTSVLDGVCSNISSGATFTYNGATFALSSTMTVDGQQYYGVNCETEDKETDDSDDNKVTLIVALVIAILAILVMIGIVIFWKLKIIPKTKTHKLTTKEDEIRYMGTRSPIEDFLWREQSFMSIREKGLPDRPMPGMSTHLGGRTTPMY